MKRDESKERDVEETPEDARFSKIDMAQDSTGRDDVDIGVQVIGTRPVSTDLETEVDENGEIDQDADIDDDSNGHAADVSGDQRPEIDQRIEVDVEIGEGDDGIPVIKIDVEVEDDVEIESDADVNIDDDNEIDTDIDDESEVDKNVDIDVEVRDDLDIDPDVDVVSLTDAAVTSTVLPDDEEIHVEFDEDAVAEADVYIVIDMSDADA
jgi:hypothetical protein